MKNKKIILIIGASAILLIGVFFFLSFEGYINVGLFGSKAILSADVLYGEAEVFFDKESLGKTPIEAKEVKSGNHKVRLENDAMAYKSEYNFLSGSKNLFEVTVNRDLGVSNVFSSGQDFWFEKKSSDTVLSVITDPEGAEVFIDNTKVGVTPFSTSDLILGEYGLRVVKDGYETQTARIAVNKNQQLNAFFKMFPNPAPKIIEPLEGAANSNLFDVYSNNTKVVSNVDDWVKAIIYWNETRGINLSGTGVNKEKVFDFFVGYDGSVYGADGDPVLSKDDLALSDKGAYLRRAEEPSVLSSDAKEALKDFGIIGGKKAKINVTGTGWLNVRSEPSLNGDILAKAIVGNSYLVLEQRNNWVKIKIEDKIGWVYSTYVTVTEE